MISTYVADVDDRAALAARGRIVCEVIWSSRRSIVAGRSLATGTTYIATSTSTTVTTTVAAATTTIAATATSAKTASAKSSTTTAESATHAESAATASEATRAARAGETILSHFQGAALPFVAIELVDSVTCVIGSVESDDSRAFRATIGRDVDVGANDGTCDG